MTKILIAPDSFKGTLSSIEICNLLGNLCLDFQIDKMPIADGGEGSIDVIASLNGMIQHTCLSVDPFGRPIKTYFLINTIDKTAYIELAKTAGIGLLTHKELNPLLASTYGVGMLIRTAIGVGCSKIIIFAGGSATNDAGIGALVALGAQCFIDNVLVEYPTGQDLEKINQIDISELITLGGNLEILLACDVNNPFYGINGAAYVYGPQKGANEEQVQLLDAGLRNFANLVNKNLNIDLQNIVGSGAAGGFSGGIYAFLGAKISKGTDLIFQLLDFDERIKQSDFVITGEGKLDAQTLNNKLVKAVVEKANFYNKPVFCICGSLDNSIDFMSILNLKSIAPMAKTSDEIRYCMANPPFYFNKTAKILIETIRDYELKNK